MKTTCQTVWKRVVASLLLCSLLLCLCACGGAASSAKKAPLKGHDTPLADAINSSFAQFNDSDEKLSLDWGNGWSGEGAPDQSTLGDSEKAVTMSMRTTTDGETETITFFLAYNTSDNNLTAKGAVKNDDGETDTASATEATSLLEIFYLSDGLSGLLS